MADFLIKGGSVVDGSGDPPRLADVTITAGRITTVGIAEGHAQEVIDATGCLVCPGFIDPHSHSDLTLLVNPRLESTVRQGVTTEVVGNCGLGVAPASAASAEWLARGLASYGYEGRVGWRSFDSFLRRIEQRGSSGNLAFLVGHGPLRRAAAVESGPASRREIARMERMLDSALDAGVLGLSTGLEYEPGRSAGLEEIRRLVERVALRDGIYASHIRNRDRGLLDAVAEFLGTVEDAGVKGQISHLNVRQRTGAPPNAWRRALALIEASRDRGYDVMTDATPLREGIGLMANLLPAWLTADGPAAAARLLRDPSVRSRVRRDSDRYWRFLHRGEWARARLLHSPQMPDLDGRDFPAIAARRGTDEWDAYFDILVAAGPSLDSIWMVGQLFSERHVADTVRHPLFLLGADTMSSSSDPPLADHVRHPLSFMGHTWYLTHHVRDRGYLRVEEAVRKMTSMVATRFGLRDRGLLAPGMAADVVVFDLGRLEASATRDQPTRYATGMRLVLVNGHPVVRDDVHTGALPGRQLRAA